MLLDKVSTTREVLLISGWGGAEGLGERPGKVEG